MCSIDSLALVIKIGGGPGSQLALEPWLRVVWQVGPGGEPCDEPVNVTHCVSVHYDPLSISGNWHHISQDLRGVHHGHTHLGSRNECEEPVM